MSIMTEKKPKKNKFNNEFRVPNEEADKIRNLSNQELLDYMTKQHEMSRNIAKAKREDPRVQTLKQQISEKKVECFAHPKLDELKEQVKKMEADLEDEELANLKEELKNENQPLAEDLRNTQGRFNLAFEEVKIRRSKGILQIKV